MANFKHSYNFYETDGTFDYGDFDCHCTDEHGFEIEIDYQNESVDISTLNAYGDFGEMNEKCKTIEELKNYLEEHLDEVQEDETYDYTYTNRECFEELIGILDEQIKRKAVA